MVEKNCDICRNFQLGFSSKIKVPQLGSARLGTFIARLGSSRKIPARAHHYKLASVQVRRYFQRVGLPTLHTYIISFTHLLY